MSGGRRTLTLLEKCKSMKQLKQTHAQIIVGGLAKDGFALSRVMAFCSDPNHGSLSYARLLFEQIEHPTICICNTMIRAFLLKGELIKTMETYGQMLLFGLCPDNYTLPYVLKASSNMKDRQLGEQIHGHIVRLGFQFDIYVGNTLTLMYTICGDMETARMVFDIIPQRDAVSWTVMISGYSKQGDVEAARFLFNEAKVKDRGIWGSMISGYVQNNCFKEGLRMFRLMQLANLDPDEGVLVSALCGCSQLGALQLGIWIHSYVERKGLSFGVRLGTAIVDMYAKCGCLGLAKKVFSEMPRKDTICWNVMILGLAMHGDGESAFKLFNEMQECGFSPDDITFIAIFTACSHSGMVDRGLREFNRMRSVYGIEPKGEHYGCVVDFLARAGLFKEAKEIIQSIPSSSSPSEQAILWRALLSSCWNHGDTELVQVAAQHLFQLERHSGVYVLLSNILAADGNFIDAKKIRALMKHKGVPKTPGCSSIELNGSVHEFVAGVKTHPQIEQIYMLLEKMNEQLESAG